MSSRRAEWRWAPGRSLFCPTDSGDGEPGLTPRDESPYSGFQDNLRSAIGDRENSELTPLPSSTLIR